MKFGFSFILPFVPLLFVSPVSNAISHFFHPSPFSPLISSFIIRPFLLFILYFYNSFSSPHPHMIPLTSPFVVQLIFSLLPFPFLYTFQAWLISWRCIKVIFFSLTFDIPPSAFFSLAFFVQVIFFERIFLVFSSFLRTFSNKIIWYFMYTITSRLFFFYFVLSTFLGISLVYNFQFLEKMPDFYFYFHSLCVTFQVMFFQITIAHTKLF